MGCQNQYLKISRQILPAPQLQQHPDIIKGSLPFVIKHLKAQSHVTHTYASAAVEKILMLKVSGVNNVAVITANDLKPLAEDLLQGLFGAFSMPGNPLVPGVVLIPLRIATKLSMTKSESILEN